MNLVTLFLVLVLMALALWFYETYVPGDGAIKTLIRIVVIIIAIVLVVGFFFPGLLPIHL